jgi:hypothetical protein
MGSLSRALSGVQPGGQGRRKQVLNQVTKASPIGSARLQSGARHSATTDKAERAGDGEGLIKQRKERWRERGD